MSVKSPLGLVLYCYLNMPTINKTYLILQSDDFVAAIYDNRWFIELKKLTMKFLSISWLPVVKQAVLNGQLRNEIWMS